METLQKRDAKDTKCKSKNAASHLALARGVWFGSGKWRIQVSAPVCWMLYHLKMQLIHSRRAQQPESSWNIYPLSHSSSYHSEKGGGRQRYVLKRLTDSTKSIWLCTCHICQRQSQLNQTATEKCRDPDVLIQPRQQNSVPSSCGLLEGLEMWTHLISTLNKTNARLKDCTQKWTGKLWATGSLKCWRHPMVRGKDRWRKKTLMFYINLFWTFSYIRWLLLDTQIHNLSNFKAANLCDRCVEDDGVQIRFSYLKKKRKSRKQQDVNSYELNFFVQFPLPHLYFLVLLLEKQIPQGKHYVNHNL